jgi:superfamily II RNA helicase
MAGRAGRRGLDPIGHVIHLTNLIRNVPTHQEYRQIICGKPQQIVSKFKIHNNLILRLINANVALNDFTTTSMITHEIGKELTQYQEQLAVLRANYTPIQPSDDILDYHELYKFYYFNGHSNKHKKIYKQMKTIENKTPTIYLDHKEYVKSLSTQREIEEYEQQLQNTKNYITDTIVIIKTQLIEDGFVEEADELCKLTPIGMSATHIQEAHSLILSELLMRETFRMLCVNDIISVLSVFIPTRKNEPTSNTLEDKTYFREIEHIKERNDYYKAKDERYMLDIGEDYTFQTALCEKIAAWTTMETAPECDGLLLELSDTGMFTGEFIKAILKLNALAKELSAVCDVHNFVELKQKLDKIPELTMKHVVSNVSLYV